MKSPGVIGRAALCVFCSLGLWWFLLRPVSTALLRQLAYIPLAVFVAPPGFPPVAVNPESGEWVFNVAVNYDGTDPQTGRPQHIQSIEFAAEPGTPEDFTAGWFSYAGLALAVGGFRRAKRFSGLKGLALQILVSVFALTAFAYVSALSAVAPQGSFRGAVRVAEYILGGVLPLAGPFAIALWIHPEWRAFFHSPR